MDRDRLDNENAKSINPVSLESLKRFALIVFDGSYKSMYIDEKSEHAHKYNQRFARKFNY